MTEGLKRSKRAQQLRHHERTTSGKLTPATASAIAVSLSSCWEFAINGSGPRAIVVMRFKDRGTRSGWRV